MDGGKGKRDPQVPKEIDNNVADVGRLAELVERLEARLAPVLRNEPPSEAEKAKVEQALVPLADDIRKIGMEVTTQWVRIESILDRLEI